MTELMSHLPPYHLGTNGEIEGEKRKIQEERYMVYNNILDCQDKIRMSK